MDNRDIIVIKNSFCRESEAYERFLKPYLDFFGFPYSEICGDEDLVNCALIIAGTDAMSSETVKKAVAAGAGLVCFAEGANAPGAEEVVISKKHYITELHEMQEVLPLYAPMSVDLSPKLKQSEVLLTCGSHPLVETETLGSGKICLWRSMAWMSHEVFGPIRGMDDLLWRSIVWAAKKPFIMQGMPPMVGMRVDDVWGAWREWLPESPLLWVEMAQEFGLKPWLGVFIDNIDEISTAKVREFTQAGLASAFPHAFVGCEWTDSDLTEHWAYLNHNEGPYSDEQMRENANRAKAWFDAQQIPISKYALAHYYETGSNALPYFKEWGCEFIGIHMNTDVPYRSGANWIKAGPYRKYEDGVLSARRPVYYGDYVFDHQFFNCVTEIRDVCGYEWAPTGEVQATIRNGIIQLRRALDSMCPAVLFTHESSWIQRISPRRWKKILSGVLTAVKDYEPEYLTMDEICRYARAKHDVCIKNACVKENKLQVQLVGHNDMDTKCYVFCEEADGNVVQKLAPIPQVDGEKSVEIWF